MVGFLADENARHTEPKSNKPVSVVSSPSEEAVKKALNTPPPPDKQAKKETAKERGLAKKRNALSYEQASTPQERRAICATAQCDADWR